MNTKQELFVAEYQVDRNATQAAVRAGYSPRRANRTGYEFLQKPDIASAIAKADIARQERLGVDADAMVQRLVDIADKAFHGAPKVTREGKAITVSGVPIMEWSPAGATRAVELLMKHLGISGTERHEIEVTGETAVVYRLKLDRELPEFEDASDART